MNKITKSAAAMLSLSLCIGLVGCGNSPEEVAEINQQAIDSLSTINIGDEVEFGVYNKKILKWNVILMTEGLYLLECQTSVASKKWNDAGGSIDTSSELFNANEWDGCSLRSWLNNEFYEEAFDDTAKDSIVKCDLNNSIAEAYTKSGGTDTQDNVFVLSYAECKEYVEPLDLIDIKSAYWLRNPAGTNGLYAAICDGYLTDQVGDYDGGCSEVSDAQGVRPAIWLTNNGTELASLNLGPATEEKQHLLDTDGNSGNKGKGEKCYLCNGTGIVKYYYGGSALEAALNGHDDYEYGVCGSCRGTGVK